jgi:hypothetical protein
MKTCVFQDGPLKDFGPFPYDGDEFVWEDADAFTRDGVELKRWTYLVDDRGGMSIGSEAKHG